MPSLGERAGFIDYGRTFEGLDKQSVQDWMNFLRQLQQKMALVLIV